MNLIEYIEKLGALKIAKKLGINKATVYSWVHMKSIPKPHTAFMIILESNGLITWEGIYEPYLSREKSIKKAMRQSKM